MGSVIKSGGDVVALMTGSLVIICILSFLGMYAWGIATGLASSNFELVERCVVGAAGTILIILIFLFIAVNS